MHVSIYLVVIVESTPAVSNYDENNDHKKQENESSKKADHHAKVVCGKKGKKKAEWKKKLLLMDSCHGDLVSCHSDSAEAVLVRHVTSREKSIQSMWYKNTQIWNHLNLLQFLE